MAAGGTRPDPGFVGRADEVARLTDALRTALAGGSPLCLVLGEAGIGKSRLAVRAAAEAQALGYDVAWTEAVEGAGPFSALAGLGVGRGHDHADAEDRRWDRLEQVVTAVATRAPVLLIVEDAHWADESSLWVLERLGRHLNGAAAPVLVTARSHEPGGEGAARMMAAADLVVRLAGLSVEEAAHLADLAAPGSRIDGPALWHRTGGVPLFVREAAVLAGDAGELPSAARLLTRRIERLGPETARVLAALALAPPRTSLVVLARALHRPVESVVAAIDTAAAEDLVVDEPGGGVRFRHALIAEAAEDRLAVDDRRALRLALAADLAAAGTPAARVEAVRQRLLALPAGHAEEVAREAVEAVIGLREAGDDAAASAVAELAAAVLGRYDAPSRVLARLHVERGEALFELGEVDGAREAYQAAVALGDDLDPATRARVLIGLGWFANPFSPDTELIKRLDAAATALGPADSPLRVRLLGRIAAVSLAVPTARTHGRRAAEDAVAMARRLGDPAALVQALADLHLAPSTRAEWEARGAAADEIVQMGERLGRPEVALLGYEWQFGERLGRGDLAGAEKALGRLELYAHLTPSPRWRVSAGLRRAGLLCLGGDRDGALHVLETQFASAGQWLQPGEITGIEMSFRTSVAFIYGEPDPRLLPVLDASEQVADMVRAPFMHATVAMAAWVIGDEARARVQLSRASAGLEAMAVGLESLFALQVCGVVAAGLGDVRTGAAVRPLLEPFAGRLGAGSGSFVVPVATSLGLVADLCGDHEAAAAFHRQGIALAERVQSHVLAERCRALARRPGSPAGRSGSNATAGGTSSVTRTPDGWTFESPLGTASVAESRGLLQLVEVLRANGREVAALDLAAADGGVPVQADLGPALDSRAKREYRARVAELREEIDEAADLNDPDRATRARLELEALLDELARAVGLHGHDRPQGATHERARVNVTRSIRRAIAAVGATAPALGAHLEVSVRTGAQCRYQPDPAAALNWEVSAPR